LATSKKIPSISSMPTLAIVGRPNVGKSLLFNRLSHKSLALVHDRPGVTRDRIVTDVVWKNREITLIDTGGIGMDTDSSDDLVQAVRREAELAMEAADALLWVVDGREGLVPLELDIASILRKKHKPVLVAANKIDGVRQNFLEADFASTGFKEIFPVSAAHGTGIDELVERCLAILPADTIPRAPKDAATKIAIVGRPNVGKSSLVNALLGDERTLVSEIAGTTRDAVEVPFLRETPSGKMRYMLVDTAGMRQRGGIRDELEQAMTGRSVHAINRCDLCLLMIDADKGVTLQDKKIAHHIHESRKPCLVLVNKWDLALESGVPMHLPTSDETLTRQKKQSFKESYRDAVLRALFFLDFAPVVFLSAQKRTGMGDLFLAVDRVAENLHTPIPTARLNRILQQAVLQQPPPAKHGKRFKFLYATPQKEEGLWKSCKIIAFCNDKRLLAESWLVFVEHQLRKQFSLDGCPIHWVWRDRTGESKKPQSSGAGRPSQGVGHTSRPQRAQPTDKKRKERAKKPSRQTTKGRPMKARRRRS